MNIQHQFSLQTLNSFNINAVTPKIFFPTNIIELAEISSQDLAHCYVLGEGSNTLFCEQFAPVVIKPSIKGIEIQQDNDFFYLKVGCAENWPDFVEFCIGNQIYGLENLALIPGSVGAAPVQNIGAYGVEVERFIQSISWFDFSTRSTVEYNHFDCQFGYRDSIFKRRLNAAGIITHVQFKLPKTWQPELSYQGLNELQFPVTAKEIMAKVIKLRQSKLPDPAILANAGSFFKNPIVSTSAFSLLQQQYPHIPNYLQDNGDIKLAAGWLIEQSGLKGYRIGDVGVHSQQALVLVNYNSASGRDIVLLAQYVQQKVREKFNIALNTEVRFIGADGEIDCTEMGCQR